MVVVVVAGAFLRCLERPLAVAAAAAAAAAAETTAITTNQKKTKKMEPNERLAAEEA